MATPLQKFTDAYASMTIATYEPLIVQWISGMSICTTAAALAHRFNKRVSRLDVKLSTAQQLIMDKPRRTIPGDFKLPAVNVSKNPMRPLSNTMRPLDEKLLKSIKIDGFPNAIEYNGKIYLQGIVDTELRDGLDRIGLIDKTFQANPEVGLKQLPIVINKNYALEDTVLDYDDAFRKIYAAMTGAIDSALLKKENPSTHIDNALKKLGDGKAYHLFPFHKIEEALSPIGIAHYYRQLYFNISEGVGPLEQAFTIAPLETFEVVYQTVMRRTHEELMESGFESTSESSIEQRTSEEISDKVSSMVQNDSSASMSANAKGFVGVWEVEASAGADFSNSTQRSRDQSSQQSKEITKRAAERMQKTFSLRTKDTNDFTTTNIQKRVIQNNSPSPVSYGLRRVLRKIKVKLQDLGPALVWQMYIPDPGIGLARSKFVSFRESDLIAIPDVPPGARPKPQGGIDTGSTSSTIGYDTTQHTHFVTLVIPAGTDREVTALGIDSIVDLEGGGKNDQSPSPKNNVQWGGTFDPAKKTYTVNIGVSIGDSFNVTVTYTYIWQPTQAALQVWEAEVAAARAVVKEQALNDQFEKQKNLITQKSKIPKRPTNDLRKEERYEVMNRLVSMLFAQGIDNSQPNPLEIEFFHKYFDINGMFITSHPSWWRPRYTSGKTGLERAPYEITDESDPAPVGSSLGWAIQLDGDERRNEFINSPWVRVCMPIRKGTEEDAIHWLAKHIEGQVGYDTKSGPLKTLIDSIADYRLKENKLGMNGPDYVTIDSTPSAPTSALTPQDVYPIINEFEVTVPTEGFVYDELKLA